MPISINPIGPNHNEVRDGNGNTLVFSYHTLVAVRDFRGREYKTNQYHSRTTSRHVNRSGFMGAKAVSPEELARIAGS
jgi:hypothetical protein